MSHPCAATQAPTVRDGPRPYHPPAMSSSHTTQANLLALATIALWASLAAERRPAVAAGPAGDATALLHQ